MAAVVGRARSCVDVRGRAWSCAVVRGRARSCVVGRARVVVRGPSFVVVCGRARSCVVVRGSAWSCVVVRGRQLLPFCRFAASTAVARNHARTQGRTTYNNALNPPGVEWINCFVCFKVRVSIRTSY